MKFLLMSNGPMANTGYGVQCALLADRLSALGHEVAVACNFGHQVGVKEWTSPAGHKIRLYPSRLDPTGADIVHGHANHWFDGDARGGWIITITDVWAVKNPMLADYNVAAWCPVDHVTVPPAVHQFFHETNAVPLAMSQHAVNELTRVGLDAIYMPLAVDTEVYKPTFELQGVDSRTYFDLPREAFVVGMVAMNKGWVLDRKGFSEAFHGFARFRDDHPDAILFVHSDKLGADGLSLTDLAFEAGIPNDALVFTNQYAYTLGFSTEMMAAAYTAMDVLLAPSHGEGFCVPMIEAMACGTPVIASDATSQAELIGPGWRVAGQNVWDQSQRSPAFMPSVPSIVACLEDAHDADLTSLQAECRAWAEGYNVDKLFAEHWVPFLDSLIPPVLLDEKPLMERVAVIVPGMRPQMVERLTKSFEATNDGTASLYYVCDPDNTDLIETVKQAGYVPLLTTRGHTFAQKANEGYAQTTEDWLFLCGEDVEFTEGWVEAARRLSARFDVIGSNDSEPGRTRNTDVAAGRHADHWFTRRDYIDDEGSCLEGPGVFAPEAYYHWWVDKEIVGLARARGVFGFAEDCRVIHHHPGYDGDEKARADDPVYMKAVEWSERDRITFMRRVPLIEGQRVTRGRV